MGLVRMFLWGFEHLLTFQWEGDRRLNRRRLLEIRVFPRPFTHGGICPPHMGDKCRGQSVNGGTHEGGHRPYGGDLTLIDYIIN